MDNTDKVVAMYEECRRMDLEILPPAINSCAYKFTVAGPKAIRYGLGAIKGVGESAIDSITAEREAHGPFRDLFDLCRRVDSRKANRRVLEASIRAGALDALGPNRGVMMATLDQAMQLAEKHIKDHQAGQEDLFGFAMQDEGAIADPAVSFAQVPDWPDAERLEGEKETLGLYLSGHPIDQFVPELERMTHCRLANLKPGPRRVAGFVTALRTTTGRRGKMAIMTLDDGTGRADAVVYSEVLQKYAELLAKGRLLVVEGNCAIDEFNGGHSLVADRLFTLDEARGAFAKQMVISLEAERFTNGFIQEFKEILEGYRPGACPVAIDYISPQASARLMPEQDWRIRPEEGLLEKLGEMLGEEAVRIEF
jgi:DNA polymerase-3 subunit alpha